MAKKAAKSKASNPAKSQDRSSYLVRCSNEDAALFERISELEGHRSVQEWLLRIAKLRARTVDAAAAAGTLDQL